MVNDGHSLGTSTVAFRRVAGCILIVAGFLALNACPSASTLPECVGKADCTDGFECRLGQCRPVGSEHDAGAVVDAGRRDAGTPDAGTPDAGTPDAGPKTCAATGSCLLGQTCQTGADCKSQFCASGVCCNEQCGGGCAACNVAGSAGTCKPAKKGTACGAYLCDGTSSECPTSCQSPAQCSYAYTCCTAGDDAQASNCAQRGLLNSCFQLPTCRSFQDDFEKPMLDTSVWWHSRVSGVGFSSVENGRLRVPLDVEPERLMNGYVGIELKRRVSLVGNSCQIEVTDVSQINSFRGFTLSGLVLIAHDNSGAFGVRTLFDSKVSASEDVEGQPSANAETAPLPAAARRFLRLSEDAGVVLFEYSPDGRNFTAFKALTPRLRPSDIRVNVSVFQSLPVRDSGIAAFFDNFNVVP
jgi:hypothetical protein